MMNPALRSELGFTRKEEIFRRMLEKDDQELKAEIDAIMNNVETIMGRVESVMPTGEEEGEQKKDSN